MVVDDADREHFVLVIKIVKVLSDKAVFFLVSETVIYGALIFLAWYMQVRIELPSDIVLL